MHTIMKSLLLAFFLLFSLKTVAQSFEGTITWSLRLDITDPEMKARMEEAKKQMQDPEKIKEMKANLEDPQVKAMMEQNPQLKAQMEKALQMLQSGDISSMIPKGMTVKVKDGHMLTKLDGGMMQNEILSRKDKKETYIIDRENKTYSVSEPKDYGSDSLDIEVTKTNEEVSILGYPCTKYRVEMSVSDNVITQEIWSTTELKGFDMSAMARQQQAAGNQHSQAFSKIEGVPLRVVVNSTQGVVTMEAAEVKRQSLSASEFEVPAGYKETKGGFGF